MTPEERRAEILVRLRALQTELRVEELAAALVVSRPTIQRDLETLAQQGAILRTHGGCVALERAANESRYHERVAQNFTLKQAIGRRAASLVEAGQSIILMDGSTIFHLATHLGTCRSLTVYTNSVALIPELSRFPHIQLCILGGEYDSSMHVLRGSLTERLVEMLAVDTVFVGANAIDKHGRCLTLGAEAARLVQVMLRVAERKILLADHTKLEQRAHVAYGTVADFDVWVTSAGLPKSMGKTLGKDTEIIMAEV